MTDTAAFLSSPPPLPPAHLHGYGSSAPRPSSDTTVLSSRRRRHADLSVAFTNPFRKGNRKAFLARINLVERNKLPDDVVEKYLAPLVQREVSESEIEAAVKSINEWFADNGYPCSRVVPVEKPGIFNKTLVLFCIEPKLTDVKLVPVDKENKPVEGEVLTTRRNTILRALDLKLNDVFEWKADGFAALMALGLFEYADAEVKQNSRESVDLILKLRERPNCRVEPGAGMTSDGRVYGDLSYVDGNFMGRGQRVHLEWQKRIDGGRSSGGLMFEDFRIGAKLPVSVKLGVYRNSNASRRIPTGRRPQSFAALSASRSNRPNDVHDQSLRYEKDRDGVMMELGYRPGRRHTLFTLSPAIEKVLPNFVERREGRSTLQGVVQTTIAHITRLPVELPTFGHLIRLEHSFGKVLEPNAQPFQKLAIRLSQYLKAGKTASIAIGSSISLGSDNLPWHEQKSLGGPMNVRGYSYGELGRYKSFGTGRIELRVPIKRSSDVEEPKEENGTDAANGDEAGASDYIKESDREKTGNLISPKMFDNLPPLVGVLFGDVAVSNAEDREVLGTSYGLGLRIGGIVSVDWTRTTDGRKSQLHFGLVDRNL